MSDPRSSIEPLDPGRVNATDPAELAYWCHELQCSETELKDAVAQVGEHVTAVRERLASRRRGDAGGRAGPAR